MAINDALLLPYEQAAFPAKRVFYNTPGIGNDNTVEVCRLPEGAIVTRVLVLVKTAFNAATTNVLTVGTEDDSGNDNLAAAGDVNEASATLQSASTGVGYVVPAGGRIVYAKYTQSGTAATAGEAVVIIEFVAQIR